MPACKRESEMKDLVERMCKEGTPWPDGLLVAVAVVDPDSGALMLGTNLDSTQDVAFMREVARLASETEGSKRRTHTSGPPS